MMTPYLTLEGVSLTLADGTPIFADLWEQFDQRPTGLIGRNGVGKTALARILAGELESSSGRCVRSGSVHYLAQQTSPLDGVSVAGLAGVHKILEALKRIEAGGSAPADFDLVDDRWDIRQQLLRELENHGLGHLDPDLPADSLSGGEAMRVALLGASLSEADFLILDEPTNHLDRSARDALATQLQRWPNGLLVVSHDRNLLETMTRIVELSPLGLHSYGGAYSFYLQCKCKERASAIDRLEQRKRERKRELQSLCQQRERLQRRRARGDRQGRESNQAKILLDRQKARSEMSAGKLQRQQAAIQERLAQRVRDAAQQVAADAPIALHAPSVTEAARRKVVQLEAAELPFVSSLTRHISLTLFEQQRVGVVGANGSGKSTLLKLLSGQLQPLSGRCDVRAECAWLDQQLTSLQPHQSTLEQMLALNRITGEAVLRMQLAQLGLDAQKLDAPSGSLSGGERLKAALACALYADPPPRLLVLDEPSNHLDLPSVQALEAMLCSYEGTLVVVSHDEVFLNNLHLTDRLSATARGWQRDPW